MATEQNSLGKNYFICFMTKLQLSNSLNIVFNKSQNSWFGSYYGFWFTYYTYTHKKVAVCYACV